MNNNIRISRSLEAKNRTVKGKCDTIIKKKVRGIMGSLVLMLLAVTWQIWAACVLSSSWDNGGGSFIFVMLLFFSIALAIFTVEQVFGCISDNLEEIAEIKQQYAKELYECHDNGAEEKFL